jgi:hypothetical protein
MSLGPRSVPPVPVPDLDLHAHARLRAVEPRRSDLDARERGASPSIEIELADVGVKHVATGVRSWPCPTCQAEVPRDQRICAECGERLFDESMLLTFDPVRGVPVLPLAVREPDHVRGASSFASHVVDVLPRSIAKRLFVYPLLFAFFCNLLVPCRFHETGLCLFVAGIGLLGLWANGRAGRE